MARHVGAYPAIVAEILERIKDTVGVDVAGILRRVNSDERPQGFTRPGEAVQGVSS